MFPISQPDHKLIFRQLFDKETSTYTYILADSITKEAVIIDPVLEKVDRDLKVLEKLGCKLKYAINTHVHADHITGTGQLKKKTNFSVKSVLSVYSGGKADMYVDDGEKIKFGKLELECRATPGHTNGCMSYVLHDAKMVFTGDAVLIGGCGRTDFQQGSAAALYDGIMKKIFSLDDDYMIYPAHDYNGHTVSTVGEEKKYNPRLTKPKEEFIEIMKNLNLDKPKYIDVALPNNLVDGMEEL